MSSDDTLALWLTFAARSIEAGNLAAGEIACRNILDVYPKNSAALNLLGTIAARLDMPDYAHACFEASTAAALNEVEQNLAQRIALRWPAHARPETEPKFLLIKSWGYGFWSDVTHVLGCLLLAEVTDRIPVTHWGANSLFGDGSGADAFRLYFDPVSNFTLDEIACIDGADFFPPKWTKANLSAENVSKWHGELSRVAALFLICRPERVAVSDFYIGVIDVVPWIPPDHPMHRKPLAEIYRYLINKYIHVKTAILSQCDAYFDAFLRGSPYVALHIRGTDKVVEDQELGPTNQACLSALAAVDPAWRIFLLTDDNQWLSRAKALCGERLVTTNCQRSDARTGVHYLAGADRVRLGWEIIIDTYLAARADRFIGNGRSNVSAIIAVLKDWKSEDCILVRPSQLMERNLFLHIRA